MKTFRIHSIRTWPSSSPSKHLLKFHLQEDARHLLQGLSRPYGLLESKLVWRPFHPSAETIFLLITTQNQKRDHISMTMEQCDHTSHRLCKIRKREKRKNLWTGGSQAAIIKGQTTLSYWWCSTGISAHSHDLEYYSNNESGFLIWPLLKAPDTYYIIFHNLYSATLSFLIWPRCYTLCFRHKC